MRDEYLIIKLRAWVDGEAQINHQLMEIESE